MGKDMQKTKLLAEHQVQNVPKERNNISSKARGHMCCSDLKQTLFQQVFIKAERIPCQDKHEITAGCFWLSESQ